MAHLRSEVFGGATWCGQPSSTGEQIVTQAHEASCLLCLAQKARYDEAHGPKPASTSTAADLRAAIDPASAPASAPSSPAPAAAPADPGHVTPAGTAPPTIDAAKLQAAIASAPPGGIIDVETK